MERILLTGGTGFFGKSILEADVFPPGTRLFLLSRNGPREKISCGAEVVYIRGDVRTVDLDGYEFDSVIHAAAPSGGGASEEEMYSILVDGTDHILSQIRKSGTVRRLLYVSSGAVYGTQKKDFLAETDPLNPVTLYGKGKVEAERMCLRSGIPCVIARCFAFIGKHLPGNAHFAAGNFLADAGENRDIIVRGDGSPIRSYLYSDDLAEWLYLLLRKGRDGEAYNVGSEEAVSILELANAVAERRFPPLKVVVEGASSGGKALRYLPSTEKIRRELNLPVPRPLKKSLEILLPLPDAAKRNSWLAMEDAELSSECVLDFHKASGNGGQHVNKTSSAVRLRHLPSGVCAVSSEFRSQHDNRKRALAELRGKIALNFRCRPDPEFRAGDPPPSLKNPQYPLWTARLLDVFAESECHPRLTAGKVGTGSSKLIKLFHRDPVLWQRVQSMRSSAGLSPLNPPEK